MRFMTIECSRSVHSIVLRMAQVNSNVFYKCYKYKKGGLFCQEVCVERFSDPADAVKFEPGRAVSIDGDDYQVVHAKIALARGGLFGKFPGHGQQLSLIHI